MVKNAVRDKHISLTLYYGVDMISIITSCDHID